MSGESNLQQIFNGTNGLYLQERHGAMFRYPLHLTQSLSNTGIDSLELSVRSYHSLKRVGIDSIGDLAVYITSGRPLKNVRGCGTKSAREIMEKLFLYQYSVIEPEKREDFLLEVLAMNLKQA